MLRVRRKYYSLGDERNNRHARARMRTRLPSLVSLMTAFSRGIYRSSRSTNALAPRGEARRLYRQHLTSALRRALAQRAGVAWQGGDAARLLLLLAVYLFISLLSHLHGEGWGGGGAET